MTIGCIEVDLETAKSFGVMGVDEVGRVKKFQEKPRSRCAVEGKTLCVN